MKFRRQPVTTVKLHWLCEEPECTGEMISTGEGFTTMETSWNHKCSVCGVEKWAPKQYPRIAYEIPDDHNG